MRSYERRVAVIKGKDRARAPERVRQSIDLLGGMESVVSPGDKVLIKPNVHIGRPAPTGATTCPDVVEEVVNLAFEAGATKVIIAESSNWGLSSIETFKACGYFEVADRTGAKLLDLKEDRFIRVSVPGRLLSEVAIPVTLLEADVVINVPVAKVHSMTCLTLSLKNMAVGVVSDQDKEQLMHHMGLGDVLPDDLKRTGSALEHSIADLSLVTPTDLIVIDGTYGQQGVGAPLSGRPANAHFIVAGFNRVCVDTVCAAIMGYKASDVRHLMLAHGLGIGEIDLDRINVLGDSIDAARTPFESGFLADMKTVCPPNVELIADNACITCRSAFAYFLVRHGNGLQKLGPITVVIGKAPRIKPSLDRRRYLFYGNCAGSNLYGGGFVPGCCPRSRRQVLQALGAMDLYEQDEGLDTRI